MRYTWDPFDELRRMQYRIGRIFEELPELAEPGKEAESASTQVPYVDVLDRDKEIVVTADMPGVDKNDIRINVKNDTLEISAEKKMEKETKEEGYIRRERGYDRFYRSIRLPSGVDESKADAKFNNGVLEITLPKTGTAKSKYIQVK